MFMRSFYAGLCLLILLQPRTLIAAPIELPILGNIVAADANGDGVYESIVSTSELHVWWRNVNYLDQRWARRSMIEIDLSSIPAGATIISARLTIKPIQRGTSASGPHFVFYGYEGDGVLDLADSDAGDNLMDTITLSDLQPFSVDATTYVQELVDMNKATLGVNIRALDEGKTFNTFDEEFNSRGFQSTNPLSPAPLFMVDYINAPLVNGDINDDGNIDAADALLVMRHILGLDILGSAQIARGDLYPPAVADGVIDISDYLLIQKAVFIN